MLIPKDFVRVRVILSTMYKRGGEFVRVRVILSTMYKRGGEACRCVEFLNESVQVAFVRQEDNHGHGFICPSPSSTVQEVLFRYTI